LAESWTFNGLALTARGKRAVEEVIEGVGIPKYRGSDLQVPFQHGSRWIKKRFDSRKVVLSMWIKGKDRADLDDAIDAFLQAIGKPGLHPLVRTLRTGETRQAQAELCSEIHFVRKNPGYAKFALELELADPFFYGTEKDTATKMVTSSPFAWTHVNEGSAPITAMVITLEGPLSNPLIRNQNNSVWIQYLGAIASGETVVIDTKYFTCLKGNTNAISIIKHGGDSYWMILEAGGNSMELETDTIGGRVTFEYYPAFY
jgi:phage-related protein